MKSYLDEILDFYEDNREMLLEPGRLEKAKQCVLDLIGGGIAGGAWGGSEADGGA